MGPRDRGPAKLFAAAEAGRFGALSLLAGDHRRRDDRREPDRVADDFRTGASTRSFADGVHVESESMTQSVSLVQVEAF
jgi:hypothetical protein